MSGAGAFFVFSVAVMKALGRLPPAVGIATMQQINVVIVNPAFLAVFLGGGARSAILVLEALARFGTPGSWPRLAGEAAWNEYRRGWTAWNHVRTAASAGAALALAGSLAG